MIPMTATVDFGMDDEKKNGKSYGKLTAENFLCKLTTDVLCENHSPRSHWGTIVAVVPVVVFVYQLIEMGLHGFKQSNVGMVTQPHLGKVIIKATMWAP